MRRVSTAFAVFFGLFALFFTASPKLWGGATNQNMLGNFFTQTAHADTPHTGDAGGDGCAGDASDGSGCAGACADGSAGACACADGGGCGSDSDGVA